MGYLTVNHGTSRIAYTGAAMETLGERIKHQRLVKRLTQEQIARAVGVTKAAVSHWENGETANLKLPTFLLLCEALGVDPWYLVFGPGGSPGPRMSGMGAVAHKGPHRN